MTNPGSIVRNYRALDCFERERTTDVYISAAMLLHPSNGISQTTPLITLPTAASEDLEKPHYGSRNDAKSTANPTKYSLGKGDGFPTQRRPKDRELTEAPMEEVRAWV